MPKVKFTIEFVVQGTYEEFENYTLEEMASMMALEFKRDVGDEVLSVDCKAELVQDKK